MPCVQLVAGVTFTPLDLEEMSPTFSHSRLLLSRGVIVRQPCSHLPSQFLPPTFSQPLLLGQGNKPHPRPQGALLDEPLVEGLCSPRSLPPPHSLCPRDILPPVKCSMQCQPSTVVGGHLFQSMAVGDVLQERGSDIKFKL